MYYRQKNRGRGGSRGGQGGNSRGWRKGGRAGYTGTSAERNGGAAVRGVSGPKKTTHFKRKADKSINKNPPLLFDWEEIDEQTVEKIQEKIKSGQLNPEKDMRVDSEVMKMSPNSKRRGNFSKGQHKPDSQESQESYDSRVSTWNVENKGTPEEVDAALVKTGKAPDIVCLQQAKFPVSGDSTDNYKWLFTGTAGSAILIKKTLTDFDVCSTESVNEHIFFADIVKKNAKEINIRVISCHIPPPTNYLSEELWVKLEKVLRDTPSNYLYLLAGDFNAQIGKEDVNKTFCQYIGNMEFGLNHEDSNENGLKLLNLARLACLKFLNTCGSKSSKVYTFKDGESKTQQDFILIPRFGFLKGIYRPSEGITPQYYWHPDYRHAIVEATTTVNVNKDDNTQSKDEKQVSSKITVSTWNIQGSTPSKIDKVLNENDLLVVCVQEVFVTSDEDLKTDNYTWYTSGKHWAKGVGIVLKKSPDIQLTKFESHSDCMCSADIQFHDTAIKIISCFVPPPEDSRNEAVKLELLEFVKGIPQGTLFFVAGDFNAPPMGSKIPENETSNEAFLKKLIEEGYLLIEHNFWNESPRYLSRGLISQITAKSVGRPHHILVPIISNLRRYKKLLLQFISFYENAIVSLTVEEYEKETEKPHFEVKDGLVHKTKKLEIMKEIQCHESVVVPPEDQEKFKEVSPSVEDLARLLKDFTLINTLAEREKNPTAMYVDYTLNILTSSFEKSDKFGSIYIEETNASNCFKSVSPTLKIKWQNIVLQEIVTSRKYGLTFADKNFYIRKAAELLVAKLGQFCYMVKDKNLYFNKGHEPVFMNDATYKDVIKVYKKEDCPTMPEVLSHIENFFKEDTDCELAFGPNFPKEDLDTIERFAEEKDLCHRYFTLASNPENTKHIAVFKKRTPQYIRDKLLKKTSDPKYTLIPPCGPEVSSYFGYIKRKGEELITPLERNSYSRYWSNVAERKKNKESGKNVNDDRKKQAPTSFKTSTPKISEPRNKNMSQPPHQENNERLSHSQKNVSRKRTMQHSYDELSEELEKWISPQSSKLSENQNKFGSYDNKELPPPKRPMYQQEQPPLRQNLTESLPKKTIPQWNQCDPIIVVWPLTTRSELEERPAIVLSENFPTEFPVNQHKYTAAVVTLPMRNGSQRKFCLSVGSDQKRVAREALDLIIKHCTVIKPRESYLCNGSAPNFIRYNVPCQTNPRTYIILSRAETGPLTRDNVREILDTFQSSYNEDVFFDRFSYSLGEKQLIISYAQKSKLNFRTFGDSPGLMDRWVCVYKLKPNKQLLEEVLKMRGGHPKYMITTDRLPPRVGMNIF